MWNWHAFFAGLAAVPFVFGILCALIVVGILVQDRAATFEDAKRFGVAMTCLVACMIFVAICLGLAVPA